MQYEYTAVRQACQEMGDPGSEYAPPITFLTVQKRHQTRLFPANQNEADRSGNVKPGGWAHMHALARWGSLLHERAHLGVVL